MVLGELPPCPFCGSIAEEIMKGYSCMCSNPVCPLHEPMDIGIWSNRPVEYGLAMQLDKSNMMLDKVRLQLDSFQYKMEYVANILEQIAALAVTITLQDGTVINSGVLARDGLDAIRN